MEIRNHGLQKKKLPRHSQHSIHESRLGFFLYSRITCWVSAESRITQNPFQTLLQVFGDESENQESNKLVSWSAARVFDACMRRMYFVTQNIHGHFHPSRFGRRQRCCFRTSQRRTAAYAHQESCTLLSNCDKWNLQAA